MQLAIDKANDLSMRDISSCNNRYISPVFPNIIVQRHHAMHASYSLENNIIELALFIY